MEKSTIKKGKLSEQKLVELYGSDTQKKSYLENGHFVGANKKTLLNKVSRYCNIEDLGNRTYRITDVYKYPLPSNFNKHKREYMIIPIIPIGVYLYIYTKTTSLITLLAKIYRKNF